MNGAGRVLVFLIESIGLTFLIGLVPPLHAVWALTGIFGLDRLLDAWLLLTIKHRAAVQPHETSRAARQPARGEDPRDRRAPLRRRRHERVGPTHVQRARLGG